MKTILSNPTDSTIYISKYTSSLNENITIKWKSESCLRWDLLAMEFMEVFDITKDDIGWFTFL